MIRRPPRSTQSRSSAASDVYKRQVRKVSYGVGVERTFPVHTPVIEKIEVVRKGDVRRAKLYYLRDLRGKAAKIREKRGAVDEVRKVSTPVQAVAQETVETIEAPAEQA